MSANNQDQPRMSGTPRMPGQGTRRIAPDGDNVAGGQYGLTPLVSNPAELPDQRELGISAAGTPQGLSAADSTTRNIPQDQNSTPPSSAAAAGNFTGAQPMDWEPGDTSVLHQLANITQTMELFKRTLQEQQQEHHQLVTEMTRMREKQEYPVPVLTEMDTLFPEASVNPV